MIILSDGTESVEDLADWIEYHGVKYVFDRSERTPQYVLEDFTPCLVVDLVQAHELAEDGYIRLYDSGAWDVI